MNLDRGLKVERCGWFVVFSSFMVFLSPSLLSFRSTSGLLHHGMEIWEGCASFALYLWNDYIEWMTKVGSWIDEDMKIDDEPVKFMTVSLEDGVLRKYSVTNNIALHTQIECLSAGLPLKLNYLVGEIDRIEVSDLCQKSKLKWARDEDENSRFFHGSLKRKRKQLAISGILKDGAWIDDPSRVKAEFLSHFRNRFQPLNCHPTSLNVNMPKHISTSQREFLESPCSREEVKRAVWDCGGLLMQWLSMLAVKLLASLLIILVCLLAAHIPVGANWLPIIRKFSSKLADWKVRLLSVGGRLSLIKSVLGNLPTYYMSLYLMPSSIQKKLEMMRNKFFIGGEEGKRKITWVKWEKCLSSRELGGLGIGSIHALNLGLIFKWIWRFLCHKNNLWARVISNIYGIKGGINEDRIDTILLGHHFVDHQEVLVKGFRCLSMCKKKLGNGMTHFIQEMMIGVASSWGVLNVSNSLICYLPLKTFRLLIKMIRGFGRVMVLIMDYVYA
ncbi:hypothetical protein Tco_0385562 [Tanacetum coccineum]